MFIVLFKTQTRTRNKRSQDGPFMAQWIFTGSH